MIKVQRSDGGKVAEGFAYETNDCTVRTLANTTGLSYKESHRLAKIGGRRDHSGMSKPKLDKMLAELVKGGNYEVKEMPMIQATIIPGARFLGRSIRRTKRVGGISVARFVRSLPKTGSFYCACSTHAFAIVDGVCKDARLMGRGVMFAAWEIVAKVPLAAPIYPKKPTDLNTYNGNGLVTPPQTGVLSRWDGTKYVPVETPARLAEMEEMKRKIARLEEMAAMKKRIAELEKQMKPKAFAATA